jgi:hypothetical protein
MAAAPEPVDDNYYLPAEPALLLKVDPKRRIREVQE